MGTSSTKKLTKYTSGTTIVTADVANAWFGGLSGSYEGTLLDVDDPRVIGHVHDGDPYDGHAGKINLVNHVTDKLQHQNLADNAVWKNNVASFLTQGEAIPESFTIGPDKYYYLDLRDIYTYVDDEIAGVVSGTSPFEEADSNGDTVDDVVRQSNHDYTSTGLDFVFASQKLDDMADATKGDNRFLFDRSKGAFRAGSVNSTQWNDGNRGDYSFASGRNTTASGDGSTAVGVENIASGDNTFVAGGTNTASGNNSAVFGSTNTVAGVANLVSGEQNSVSSGDGNAISGREHTTSSYNSVIGGKNNLVEGDYNLVVGYLHNVDDNGNLVSGNTNYSRGNYNATFGSGNFTNNDGGAISESEGTLVSGTANESRSKASILAGDQNLTVKGSNYSAAFGQKNESQSPGTLMAGLNNTAFAGSTGSVLVGTYNATNAPYSLIFGKEALGKVDGEITHASGKFTNLGDAQTSEYTVRGSILNPFGPPGLILSVDGLGKNYQMDLNAAYHVSVMIVGKLAGPAQEAGAYKLEALAFGPTTTPAGGTITSILTTYVSRTPYFLGGPPYVNATLSVSPGTNNLQVNVSDNHPVGNFIPSNWVATVKLTKCRF
jgi:hypothetical protein